jgi:sporulation protein YlmC with PRC-barrel domain
MGEYAGRLLVSRVWTQNGPVGKIRDILFDDREWNVEHIVVEKHRWLPLGKVLIEPPALKCPCGQAKIITGMKREDLRKCPPASERIPLAKRKKLVKHVRQMGFSKMPAGKTLQSQGQPALRIPEKDSHLCSARRIAGYRIRATDGDIGIVDDIKLNPTNWCVEGLVVGKGRAGIHDEDIITTELIREISAIRDSVTLTSTKDEVLHALK